MVNKGGDFMRNLKKIRKLRGLKQKELAEMVGVTESAISQYESGNKVPSFEVALKLAEALDCESADLVSERDVLFEKNKPVTTTDDGLDSIENLSEKDKRFIKWFRSLSEEKQKAILIAQDAPADLF